MSGLFALKFRKILNDLKRRPEDAARELDISSDEIKKIFDNVKDSDVELLGFDPKLMHPKNLVLSVIPVLPPISRPYVVNDNATCDDDLTLQYIEIIKANNHMKDENLDETKKQKHTKRARLCQSIAAAMLHALHLPNTVSQFCAHRRPGFPALGEQRYTCRAQKSP